MYINTFHYKPEDVDCTICTEYIGKRRSCTRLRCPFLAERIEAGVVGYEQIIQETFHSNIRLNTVIQRFSGSLFLDPKHRQRMEHMKARQGYRRKRDTPAYFAAMYLLSANDDLYRRSANCFCKHGIEFDYVTIRNISPHNYTLFSAARDIYTDASSVALSDLSNAEVTDTVAFNLIVNALLIVRYGCAVLEIRERSKK